MAFADPQSITINAVPFSMPRISSNDNRSIYQYADGTVKLTISHQMSGTRRRHMVRVDQTVIAEDPLTAENVSQGLATYLVIDEPSFGFTDAEIGYVVAGLVAWLTAGNVADVCEAQH